MREYLLIFFVGASVTYLTTGLAGRFAHWVGAALPVRDRDVHEARIPRLGGVAMLLGLMAAMLVASYLPRMREVFVESSDARALIAAAVVMCLVGAADDIFDLPPMAKFAGQLVSAGLLVTGGVQLLYLPVPGGFFALSPIQGQVLSIIIVVGAANAVNFVDGLDGLATGIVAIGAAAFFTYAYIFAVVQGDSRLTTPALVAVVLMSMCAGFLPHNVHPARIFMGDAGAMPLGMLLAAATITLTGRFSAQNTDGSSLLLTLLPIMLPLAVILIPALDTMMAIIRRTRAGLSVSAPDKKHLHHRLLALGHTHRRAVLIMWVWAAVLSFGVVLVALVGGWATYALVAASVLLAVVLTIGFPSRASRRVP